jgi:transcriptional regulator of met regulon
MGILIEANTFEFPGQPLPPRDDSLTKKVEDRKPDALT